ncbi:2',3'-cyclic-nucleotide 2'-phosphodiesterase [Shewanella sp. UCD-KL12]|uniref:2',3'-cyclic-nucleotide 2'-phosphodiesterase n=1 Tax=Shewanella sp. UCD-KL12 TaxID=1917163 RepID=UPI000970AEA0|nr:2',3'-cyclic-nucleotide 2'-phosphodiesterase [Shewanella sp. UCD-KL12]
MIKYRSPSQQSQYVIWALTFTIFIFTTFWSVLFFEYIDPDSYLWKQFEQVEIIEPRLVAEGVLEHLFNAVLFSAFLSISIYFVLKHLFIKVSQRGLPEGFYTQNSWLDVDDKYLVLIQADELVFFKFERKVAKRLQIEYQHGETIDALIALAEPHEVQRIPFDEINELVSDHNSDIFYVKHHGVRHKVVFINQAVKAHALELVQLLLPEELAYHRNERTKFKAALPFLTAFIGLVIFAMTVDMVLIRYLFSLTALFIAMPKLFSSYMDPKVTETWSHNEVST